jgi:hypothetical protein
MPTRSDDSPKKGWVTPELLFDGELRDFVQGSNKPPTVTGEGGDPGHRPESR